MNLLYKIISWFVQNPKEEAIFVKPVEIKKTKYRFNCRLCNGLTYFNEVAPISSQKVVIECKWCGLDQEVTIKAPVAV